MSVSYAVRARGSTNGLTAWIIREIVAALAPHSGGYQIFFVFHACRAHLGSCVFATCGSLGAWPVIVPPQETGLLQMLDTHAYRAYKGAVQGAYQDARGDGPLNMGRFLECVYIAIEDTIQNRSWRTAFNDNGLGTDQASLCDTVWRRLQLDAADAPSAISSERPRPEDVQLCFSRNATVPAPLFTWMAARPAAPPAICEGPASSSACRGEAVLLAPPERRVTRSMTRSIASAASSAEHPPCVVAHRLLPRRYIPPSWCLSVP